jgi:hypothetical protein
MRTEKISIAVPMGVRRVELLSAVVMLASELGRIRNAKPLHA